MSDTELSQLYSAQTLLDFSNRLSTAVSPNDLIAAYTEVASAEHIQVVTLYYIDNDENGQAAYAEVAASQAYVPDRQGLPVNLRFFLPDFSMTRMWLDNPNSVVLIGDRATSPRVDEASRAVFAGMGATSFALLPLFVNNKWAGLMQIDFAGTREFAPEATTFYLTMARTMAWRVATLREAETLRKQADRISLINQVNTSLARATSEQEILSALGAFADRFGASLSYMHYAEQDNQGAITLLTLEALRMAGGQFAPIADSPFRVVKPETLPTIQRVLDTPDQITFFEDLQDAARFTEYEREMSKVGGAFATITVPLRAGTRWEGVLSFAFAEKQTFSAEMREICTTLRPSIEAVVIARRNLAQTEKLRKQAEGSLQVSEKRLRAIIDNTPAWVFVKDRNYRYTLVNDQFAAALHQTSAGTIGKDDLELGFPEEIVLGSAAKGIRGFRADDDDILGGGARLRYEEPVVVDGEQRTFITSKLPLRDANQQIDAVLGVAFDITDRVSAEKDRNRLIRELREISRFKDEFLATMSHELRTPLNAMIGLLGIVLMGNRVDDRDRNMITRARANSERLLSLINNILDISRIEAGRLQIVPGNLSVHALAERVHNDLRVLAEQKKIAFNVQVEPSVPETIFADEDAINKIMVNLVSNAIKFTEQGGVTLTIRSQIEYDKPLLVIEIKDTGIGIPEHMQEIIFESFRQVDSSSTRAYGGSGLGLSIVRSICLALKGNYRVQSEVGAGSTFTIVLPLEAVPVMHA